MQLTGPGTVMVAPAMNDAWGEATRLSFDELCRAR
jgi:hypothetical protein